jgi:hypothetical protein
MVAMAYNSQTSKVVNINNALLLLLLLPQVFRRLEKRSQENWVMGRRRRQSRCLSSTTV